MGGRYDTIRYDGTMPTGESWLAGLQARPRLALRFER